MSPALRFLRKSTRTLTVILQYDRGILVALGTSLIYTVAFNLPAMCATDGHPKVDLLVGDLLFAASFFLFLSLLWWLFAPVIVVAFTLTSVMTYYTHTFGISPNPHVWAVLLETNRDEAFGLIGTRVVLWSSAAFAFAIAIAWLARRVPPPASLLPRLSLAVLLSAACVGIVGTSNIASLGMPISLVTSYREYCFEQENFEKLLSRRRDISNGTFTVRDQDTIVVFIIGEAARPDHFHINGYHRPTSPRLEEAGAISFPYLTVYHTATRYAVPRMTTRTGFDSSFVRIPETSFISVFKKLGFTTAWISNQGFLGIHDTPVSVIASEAAQVHFVNPTGNYRKTIIYDGNLLPLLDRVLTSAGNSGALVVLHTIGSHWRYDSHYPPDFRKFVPTCDQKSPKSCSREQVINSYDNTILYTDWFLGEVIARVRNQSALVVYASDHGESLGEEGTYAHWIGSNRPEQRKAAMFIWVSEELERRDPGIRARLNINAERQVRHRQLFHTVLDCAGISGTFVDRRESLCR